MIIQEKMKIMAAGDLHGSGYYAKLLREAFDREQPDRLITLGDMIYQGVRNPLTREFSGINCVDILNEMADQTIGVRGNCDGDVHQEFLNFPMMSDYVIFVEGKRAIFATHGHLYNEHQMPKIAPGDVLLFGHYHKVLHEWVDGRFVVNPGSLGCPNKDGMPCSYLIIEDGKTFIWKTIEGEEYYREVLE